MDQQARTAVIGLPRDPQVRWSNFQGRTTAQFKHPAIVPHVIVTLAIVGTTLRNDPHRFVSRRVIVARVLISKH
jgi:hypothetical protein